MHICKFTDRLIDNRGKLTRVVTAHWKDKVLDIYKMDEFGRERVRNLYQNMMGGYCVSFPGEQVSRYNPRIQLLDSWATPNINIKSLLSGGPSRFEESIIVEKYPNFKYVLQKCKLTINEIIRVLPIWKAHPEVELLLSAGYKRIAFSKSFYKLTPTNKKALINILRTNVENGYDYSVLDLLVMHKSELKHNDLLKYKSFCRRYGTGFSYKEYLFLRNRKPHTIDQYRDYKAMLKRTSHSIRDDYWHYPKNIGTAHSKIMQEIKRLDALKKEEDQAQKQKGYLMVVKKYLKKKIETRSGISVYVPESIDDIKKQADSLNQCLITSDYIGRVIQKKCVLLFVREGEIPIATAELRPDGSIGQFYGNELNHNDCLPPKKAKYALEKWTALYSRRISA